MSAQSAVIDNNSLSYFTQVERNYPIFKDLRSVFANIYVPTAVKVEFERIYPSYSTHRKILKEIRPSGRFIQLCTRFDIFDQMLYQGKKGIDLGEAEAAAQHKKIHAHYIISDDIAFAKALGELDPYVKVVNTLFLIAFLDLQNLLTEPTHVKRELHGVRPFSEKQLREAYKAASKELGRALNWKDIRNRTKFSKLGIK